MMDFDFTKMIKEDGPWMSKHETIHLRLPDGTEYDYRGECIEPKEASTEVFLELNSAPSTIKKAILVVPFLSSTPGRLDIYHDDQLIGSYTYNGSKVSQMDILEMFTLELPPCVTCSNRIELRLVFKSIDLNTKPIILLGKIRSIQGFGLVKKWARGHSLKTVALFVMIWLVIFEVLFVIAAYLPILRNLQSGFSIVVPAVLWFLALVGAPDLLKIPVKRWVRRTVCWIRDSKRLAAIPLAISCVAMLFPVILITQCLLVRHIYTSTIEDYVSRSNRGEQPKIEELESAFEMVPWRPETMALVEARLRQATEDNNPERFRKIASHIVDSEQVKLGLDTIQNHSWKSWCVCSNTIGPLDPLLWYAALLPTAEGHRDMNRKKVAVELLRDRKDASARIYKLLLELEIIRIDQQRLTSSESETEQNPEYEVNLRKSKDLGETLEKILSVETNIDRAHFYQEGADQLAQHALDSCDVEKAIHWYSMLVSARSNFQTGGVTWLRPPKKMSVYHLYRVIWNETGETAAMAESLLDKCPAFRSQFKQKVYNTYPDLKSKRAWLKNSLSANEMGRIIGEDFLRSCWRY